MGVDVPVLLAHAGEPRGEVMPLRLAAGGQVDRFDELPQRQELRLLGHRLEAVGAEATVDEIHDSGLKALYKASGADAKPMALISGHSAAA